MIFKSKYNLGERVRFKDEEYEVKEINFNEDGFNYELKKDFTTFKASEKEVERVENNLLSEKDRAYLRVVIEPFRDKIKFLSKIVNRNDTWLYIKLENEDSLALPNNIIDLSNLENKIYTLTDLGL